MIMQNNPEDKNDRFVNLFTNILHAAQKHWDEFRYDSVNRMASGILVTHDGRVLTAEMSFNEITNRLTLIVRLQVSRRLSTSEFIQVLRFQNQQQNLASFLTIDDENNLASVRSVLPVYVNNPDLTVKSIFDDTICLLEDDQLKYILN